MPTEKHQERARELLLRREATLNYDTLTEAIAAALESVEQETAERCAQIALAERVNEQETGDDTDAAYNQACGHIEWAIRAEFGIAEKA